MADWFAADFAEVLPQEVAISSEDGEDHLSICLHPAAEELRLHFDSAGSVTAEANTGWGGPGFHKHVCEVLDRLGRKFSIVWTPSDDEGDDTSFFRTRDWAALQAAVNQWFQALCQMIVKESMRGAKPGEMAIGMPVDVQFTGSNDVQTPFGPRPIEWFRAQARNPRAGDSLLGWIDEADNALAWRGRALAAMWQSVRWCRPRTEAESRVHSYVINALEQAHTLDPVLEKPWREWRELAELNDVPVPSDAWARAETSPERPLIGYRRHPVILRPFAGWSITLPGSMSEDLGETGPLWFDDNCDVRLSTMMVDGSVPSPRDLLRSLQPPPGDDLGSWTTDGTLGRMAVGEEQEEDGTTRSNFQAVIAGHGEFAVCTVSAPDRSYADSVTRIFRSIRGPIKGRGER
jgi:hypothetical protein